jgi:hypothetical protein
MLNSNNQILYLFLNEGQTNQILWQNHMTCIKGWAMSIISQ